MGAAGNRPVLVVGAGPVDLAAAGFLAAWPVNHVLLKHELKAGH